MHGGELAALLARYAGRHPVPGAAVGVLRDRTTTVACHGVGDVATGEPVTAQTRFSAGSLTKPMVATVIARLAGDGRLALDDPVAAHVPELTATGWAHRATLRDLLANRSGLPLRVDTEFGFASRTADDDGALARLVADVAGADPAGDFWSYTNVGWCLLGRAIETATGTAWEDAMRRYLIDGAGMLGTRFATGRARAYGPAGTTITSTVMDLLRFAAMHLADPSLAALRTTHAEISIHGWLDAWCLGWAWFDWAGGPVWGWDGRLDGERTALRLVPHQRAAIVVLTNGSTGRALYRPLIAELMRSQFGIEVPAPNLEPSPGAAGDLARFAGVYAWPDRRIEVTATESGLLIGDTEALPLDGRTFLLDAADPDNPTVTFGGSDPAGRPRVLYDVLWGLPRR